MSSLKEIKARISSVSNTLKITQAMKMVASAKLRKAQRMVGGLDAYREALYDILDSLREYVGKSSLASAMAGGKCAIVVFSSNTALCGSYNANVFKALGARLRKLEGEGTRAVVIPVGEKVAKMARKDGYDVTGDFVTSGDRLSYDDMSALGQYLIEAFLSGTFSRVELLYTHYHSASRQSLESRAWLPVADTSLARSEEETENSFPEEVIVEPGKEEVVEKLLPLAMRTDMYATLLSSNASENACRMIAMQTASDNAEELLAQLRLTYNKQRQQDITAELTDISNGKLG